MSGKANSTYGLIHPPPPTPSTNVVPLAVYSDGNTLILKTAIQAKKPKTIRECSSMGISAAWENN
jgi:hypothetical protein